MQGLPNYMRQKWYRDLVINCTLQDMKTKQTTKFNFSQTYMPENLNILLTIKTVSAVWILFTIFARQIF